nr:immunoglobulin light chain junction region [Macaca mulatta]
CTQGLEFPLTF